VGRRDLDPARAWNTWDSRYPAQFVHAPTGFCVRVSAFSTREGRFTDFRYDPAACRLGPHALDGSYAEVELTHAGSRLRVRFGSAGDVAVAGDVEILETAEWGLRFWFLLEAGFEPSFGEGTLRLRTPGGEAAYVDAPTVTGRSGAGGAVAFVSGTRPVAAHLYADRAEAGREFETHGYYFRPPDAQAGRWAVLRCNAVTPHIAFAAAVAPGPEDAEAATREALGGAEALLAAGAASCAAGNAPDAAIRDVVAWNTVWDAVNDRPYTVATRTWAAEKFGGWFVWQSDSFYHAILATAAGDHDVARWNGDAALSCATPFGNLAGLRSGLTDWVDRAHPPLGGHAVWEVHRRHPDRDLLERAYPVLRRAFDWWFEARDGNGNGLLEYGSSPAGDGHFVHTKLAAMDESSNDNSPVHDEATFDSTTHTLDMEDVGLNSLLVWEAEHLARIARALGGMDADAAALDDRREALAALVREHLWDDQRGIFANRLWSGSFVRSVAPTSFYPMTAGIATPEQAERMVREHLLDPSRFGGDWPVAGTPHEDPAAADNVYWRGRAWPPFNYLVFLGLRRYGYEAEARALAERSGAMFDLGWRNRRSYENFNQRTGEGGDSSDSDSFYTWGALLPLLGLLAGKDADEVIGSG
jgi:Mannosylglycerate hydrolase MGH1-like glycoside hydrolase domain